MKSVIETQKNMMVPAAPPKTQVHTIKRENLFAKQTQFKHFYTELPCVEYIKTKNNLHLFGEDVSADMRKQFYAIDYNTIYLLSKTKKFHLYEYFNDEPLKLFLDIDIAPKNIPATADKQLLFDDIIATSIGLINDKLKEQDIENPEIIVLKSSSDIKLSAHIIFPDIVFKNIKEMKFFMSTIKTPLIDNGIIDPLVYKKGAFRCLWNSKCGKNINLDYYKSFNYAYTNDKDLFMDCLVKNINRNYYEINVLMPVNVNIIKKTNIQQRKPNLKNDKNVSVNQTENTNINHPVSSLKLYVDILSIKRTEKYDTWIKIGMILHNCNPTEECFNLWDNWSNQSTDNYSSRDENAYKWNSFILGHYSIASLKYYAKIDNPDLYPSVGFTLGTPIFESNDFTSDYLLSDQNETIKENKSFVSQHIMNWMESNEYKSLAIKSCYNSGKTDIIKKIITEFEPKKILYISYRQTLTYELLGNFKGLGVKSYLNGDFHADRLICQIESLYKIITEGFDGYTEIPSYDLVIIDEIESILNHFMSSTIENKTQTFDFMHNVLYNSNKILALDGDFNNRSYEFLAKFGKCNVLNNLVKKDKRHYIFTNYRMGFENDIAIQLVNGKNIIIVSMSSKLAMYFYNKYNKKYKTILHCAKSGDEEKLKLQEITEYWQTAQLLIYSPSVESGCNFNISHFHKIYKILSSKSTSPRGLMQMGFRVRQVEDPNIMVYLNNIPYKEKANFYSYDEIKEYVSELYQKFYTYGTRLDTVTNKFVIEYSFDLYAKVLIHNEVEKANKSINLFVPYLIKLLTEKGHTFEHADTRPNKHAYKKDTLMKDEIFNADDCDENIYNTLFKKLCNNEATREDKVIVEKHKLKKDWKIDEVTDEFLSKFYGKTNVLYNLRFLLNNNLVKPFMLNENDKYSIVFDKAAKLEEVKMISEVILGLGFDIPITNKIIERETFLKNISAVIGTSQLFLNLNKSQPLFGFDKVKIGLVKNVKQFMGFMNVLLGDWGLRISCKQKNTRDIKNMKKIIKINYYSLSYIDNINIYI